MLQKIYWLSHIQSEHIHATQEFRTLFCKHEFPHLTFLSPAFAMVGGGLVSNVYAWTLVINNRSIIVGAGSAYTPVDEVSEQIRLPARVEVACMLELARLFKSEGAEEGRQKWLNAAYGDTALYPSLQSLIRDAMDSNDIVVESQKVLSVPSI
jgi:hypothetical protein